MGMGWVRCSQNSRNCGRCDWRKRYRARGKNPKNPRRPTSNLTQVSGWSCGNRTRMRHLRKFKTCSGRLLRQTGIGRGIGSKPFLVGLPYSKKNIASYWRARLLTIKRKRGKFLRSHGKFKGSSGPTIRNIFNGRSLNWRGRQGRRWKWVIRANMRKFTRSILGIRP